MQLTYSDVKSMGKVRRLKLINSLSGIKPANLIGTISESGNLNLAIFSSVVHIGSNPPLLGFFMRPTKEVPRHTYENLKATGEYTINHVHTGIAEKAHFTSAKFDRQESEFEHCGLTPEYIEGFKAPFVKESLVKLGMKFVDSIPIEANNTVLVIGEIHHIVAPDSVMTEDGDMDLTKSDTAGISGLNNYYSVKKIAWFPYARPDELPDF